MEFTLRKLAFNYILAILRPLLSSRTEETTVSKNAKSLASIKTVKTGEGEAPAKPKKIVVEK